MPHIDVDVHQASLITNAGSTVHVRDPQGRLIGFITPAPPQEEIAMALKRLAEGPQGPTCSTLEVLTYLQSLENR